MTGESSLTSTSYAILALLALRESGASGNLGEGGGADLREAGDNLGEGGADLGEGGADDVTGRMDSGLRFYWPRARGKFFEESKRLVAQGLAQAQEQTDGTHRRRTVYWITPGGKRALMRWLSDPGAGPVLEFEALLKLSFADMGTLEGLKANIEAIRDEAQAVRAFGRSLATGMLEGRPGYTERMHVGVLVWHFLDGWAAQRERWAAFALAWVSDWDSVEATPARLAAARAWFEDVLDQPPT